LGYAASEIVGTSINRMIPLDRLDEEESIARKIQQGDKAAPFETMQLAKDGRPLEVSVTASPIRDAAGKIVGTSKVVRDIIAPKREEEKMRRMATVVKDSNDAITIQDFEGRITAWNRGAELMYGYGEAEALTTNIERLTTPGKVAEQKNFIRRHGGRAWQKAPSARAPPSISNWEQRRTESCTTIRQSCSWKTTRTTWS